MSDDEKIRQAIRDLLLAAFDDDTDYVMVTIKALKLWKRLHDDPELYVGFRGKEVPP